MAWLPDSHPLGRDWHYFTASGATMCGSVIVSSWAHLLMLSELRKCERCDVRLHREGAR